MRIFNGIQSSARPHLGNILGCVLPTIKLFKENISKDNLFFIADLHSLTSLKDAKERKKNIFEILSVFLSFGLQEENCTIFLQSKIKEILELNWYLTCHTPYKMICNAHSFKDKQNNLSEVNCGIFTYPILMSSDILIFDSEIVPVGKDQIQHIEITRDIAKSFNFLYGESFKVPTYLENQILTIKGTDGKKMSKSYKNTIDIFDDEKNLKKKIMSIKTSTQEKNSEKDFENCNIYNLYKEISSDEQKIEMQKKYKSRSFGFADAKNDLFSLIMDKFSSQREFFQRICKEESYLLEILEKGGKRAKEIACKKIEQIRKVLGF
jgi:tryptophanyl-tRNA synthetase